MHGFISTRVCLRVSVCSIYNDLTFFLQIGNNNTKLASHALVGTEEFCQL